MMSAKLKNIISDDKEYLFQNYGDRLPVCFTKGDGSFLYDQDKKKYIDFFSGIAVSNLGYNNKSLSKALHNQIDKIIHSSNWYYNIEQNKAAKLLSRLSFPGKTLFVNSGTEANEAAIKLSRKYGLSLSEKKYEIISFSNSFHGRTLGSMTATGQEKIYKGFGPLPGGFKHLPFNDTDKFVKEINKNNRVAAVFTELIQGEGGIVVADKKFIKTVSHLCKKRKILLIIDEIQTGIARTGRAFAYQHYGIIPDIITVAKGLGGGIPIGAIHAKSALAKFLSQGNHGTTFGGNHMATAAAAAVLEEVKKNSFQNNIKKISEYIFSHLDTLKKKTRIIKGVRGLGLHIGIELDVAGMPIVKEALKNGLIINCTANNIIRIMPPLNIKLQVVKSGMRILDDIIINNGLKK